MKELIIKEIYHSEGAGWADWVREVGWRQTGGGEQQKRHLLWEHFELGRKQEPGKLLGIHKDDPN